MMNAQKWSSWVVHYFSKKFLAVLSCKSKSIISIQVKLLKFSVEIISSLFDYIKFQVLR